MGTKFYKLRRGKVISGVLAGLSDKYNWDLSITRILFGIFVYFSFGFAVFLYILLAVTLPYKEDLIEEEFGRGPRKRKDADVVDDKKDGWYW